MLDVIDLQEDEHLDMNAAFNTIDFVILLQWLKTTYRLNGTVLEYLTGFVTDRTQVVIFHGNMSSPVKLICGVLHGSVRC